ncbi:MAG: TolC family protein [Brevinemataceae bacterium]
MLSKKLSWKLGFLPLLSILSVVMIFGQEGVLPKSLFPEADLYDLELLLQKDANFEDILQGTNISNEMSLQDTIEMAIQNNLELAQAKKEMDSARALYTGSVQDFYVPSLSVGVGAALRDLFTTSKDPVIIAETEKLGFTFDLTLPSITLSKNIFNGFADFYAFRIAKENYLNAQNTYTNKMREIVYQTVVRYYDQFLKLEEVKVSLERIKQLRDQLEQAQINFRNGRVSDYDVALSRSQYFAAQPVFFAAEKNRLFSREDFYRYIGFVPKPGEAMYLKGNLYEVTNIQFTAFDEEVSLAYILSNDTQLVTLRTAFINAKSQKGIQNSVRMPKINVQFDYTPSWGRDVALGSFGESAYNGAYGVGISLRVPILDWIPGTGTASKVKSAEQKVIQSSLALLQAEQERIIQVKNTLLTIREFGQSVESLRISEQQADRASQISRIQYQNGRISILELNQAQVEYIDAKKQLLFAIYNELQAKLTLQESINNLPAFIEEVSKLQN